MNSSSAQSTLPPPPPIPPDRPHQDPPAPRSPEETARSAAQWLGGTGATLLLVAAAVLVAVRWDDLTALMKLAGLIAANGTILLSGLRFRDSVPATARALYHLGALLIPISTVAVGIQVELPWQWTLLASSVITIASLSGLQRVEASRVLRWLTLGAVVPLAGGTAAVTGAPAGVLLTVAALAALQLRSFQSPPDRIAPLVWAGTGASLAFLVGIDDPFIDTANVITELGLGSSVGPWAYLTTGLLGALAFGIVAHRDKSEPLALASLAIALSGFVATAIDVDTTSQRALTGAVALAVALEVAAMLTTDRRPWKLTLGLVSMLGEGLMAVATLTILGLGNDAASAGAPGAPTTVTTSALLVVGWLVADQRRRVADCQPLSLALMMGGGWWPATVGTAAAAFALVATATGSATVTAWTAVGLAVLLVPSGRAGAHVVAGGIGLMAVTTTTGGWSTVAVAATMALALAGAAGLRTRADQPAEFGAVALMIAALGFILGSVIEMQLGLVESPTFLWLSWSGGALVCTVIAERGTSNPVLVWSGLVGRVLVVAPFLPALFGFVWSGALSAGVLAIAFVAIDLHRSRDARLAYFGAPLLPAVAIMALDAVGVSAGQTGVVLAIAATTVAGAFLSIGQWNRPAAVTGGVAAISALVLSFATPGHLSTTLLILGGALLTVAIDRQSLNVYLTGGLVVTAGLWMRLGLMEVSWSEPYVAPLALLIVILGVHLSRQGVNSWWTHGTAVALLGGAALIERIAAGAGEHALIAGTVAVVAVVLGAQHRLIGPLVAGTLLVFAVAAHESLVYAATIPTWGWLALAGSVLLTSAVLIERTATSPLESSRKVLETVQLNYR